MNYELRIRNYELQITNYELRITNYELQITNYKLRITNYELLITNYKLRITSHPKPPRLQGGGCLAKGGQGVVDFILLYKSKIKNLKCKSRRNYAH